MALTADSALSASALPPLLATSYRYACTRAYDARAATGPASGEAAYSAGHSAAALIATVGGCSARATRSSGLTVTRGYIKPGEPPGLAPARITPIGDLRR